MIASILILVVMLSSVPVVSSPTGLRKSSAVISPLVVVRTINMVKLRTQNVTQISVNPPCYNGKVALNVTSNLLTVYSVTVNAFLMVVTTNNVVIENSTSVSYISPSNNLGSFFLFPNLAVTLLLDFNGICVPSLSQVILLYNDGVYQFRFNIP